MTLQKARQGREETGCSGLTRGGRSPCARRRPTPRPASSPHGASPARRALLLFARGGAEAAGPPADSALRSSRSRPGKARGGGREVNAPVRRQTTPGVPAAFCPRGDPAGARAMRLLSWSRARAALPDPCPGLRDPRPESNPGLCLFVSEVCGLSGTCPGTRRWPCRAVARHQCDEIKIRLLG